jgi:hypothetical protein
MPRRAAIRLAARQGNLNSEVGLIGSVPLGCCWCRSGKGVGLVSGVSVESLCWVAWGVRCRQPLMLSSNVSRVWGEQKLRRPQRLTPVVEGKYTAWRRFRVRPVSRDTRAASNLRGDSDLCFVWQII